MTSTMTMCRNIDPKLVIGERSTELRIQVISQIVTAVITFLGYEGSRFQIALLLSPNVTCSIQTI